MHIDMNPVLKCAAGLQRRLRFWTGEHFHISRVHVHATVFTVSSTFDDRSIWRDFYCSERKFRSWREAVNWQADPDDEVHDWQVHRNLQHVATTNTSRYAAYFLRNNHPIVATTSLTASAQIPTVSTLAHGRAALSSFRRHSFKGVICSFSDFSLPPRMGVAASFIDLHTLCNSLSSGFDEFHSAFYYGNGPVVGYADNAAIRVVQMQFDIVDLFSEVHPPPWRPGKRRRGPLDPILHESPPPLQEHTSKQADHANSASFNGVRYRVRSGCKPWTAEIRQGKNKVWIGDFKSEAQAARTVDAAHCYYGRTDLVNFVDAPQLLSARPAPAASLTDAEKKLQFVKKEAKWLVSRAPSCPSSPSARASLRVVESSRGRLAATFEFRSLSEIGAEPATGSANEVDDAVSQLQHSYNLMPDSGANGIQTMDHDTGAAIESLIPEGFPFLRENETMDTMNDLQMLEDYQLGSPSPAPALQMENRLDWQGNVEELLEQGTEEIWRLMEQ